MSNELEKPIDWNPGTEPDDANFDDLMAEMNELFTEFSSEVPIPLPPEKMAAFPDERETVPGEMATTDLAYLEMQATFLAIMQQVLRPVTRYIKAVINGTEKRELFEVINFTVTPLIEKVEKVELFQHTANLLEFKGILTRILATHFGTLAEELRQELVGTYMEIHDAFDLDMRGNVRAVGNILGFYRLLCFNREIDVDQIRRFFAIGIPSVTWIRRTASREIASLSGMSLETALLLKRLAKAYREPMKSDAKNDKPAPDERTTSTTALVPMATV